MNNPIKPGDLDDDFAREINEREFRRRRESHRNFADTWGILIVLTAVAFFLCGWAFGYLQHPH
jgi:hypothetical protein